MIYSCAIIGRVTYTAMILTLADCVAVADSSKPCLIRLICYQWRGDPDMMVYGSCQPVSVHNTVAVHFQKDMRGLFIGIFAMLFFTCYLTPLLTSGFFSGHALIVCPDLRQMRKYLVSP